jgi:predicted kinase
LSKKHLICLGGLPGSGKTTLATLLAVNGHLYAADDYFMRDGGEYNFDSNQLPAAHMYCQLRVRNACEAGAERVIVHNTISNRWESEPYKTIAEEYGYNFFAVTLGDSSISLEDLASRNTHQVPLERLEEMALGDAVTVTADSDPRPPWERD